MTMLGFLKGSIDVQLPKVDYAFGETVEGTLVLRLKKSVKARGLCIQLVGECRQTRLMGGRRSTRVEKVYDFKLNLDNEKTFAAGEQSYSFKLKLPKNSADAATAEGVTGTLMKAAQMFSGTRTSLTKWYLTGYLDVPFGFDVSKKVQLQVN